VFLTQPSHAPQNEVILQGGSRVGEAWSRMRVPEACSADLPS